MMAPTHLKRARRAGFGGPATPNMVEMTTDRTPFGQGGKTLTAGTWTRLGDVIQRVVARIPNKPFSSVPAVPPQAVRENFNAVTPNSKEKR